MNFLSGISITCFAASYTVAWLLEGLRVTLRFELRRTIAIGFAAAGFVAHTLYLGYRAADADASPLSSSFDWSLVVAWLLMTAYFYFTYYYPLASSGLFVFPVVLALVMAAALFADRTPYAAEPASHVWGMVHGVFLMLGFVTVMVGFVAGLMYLVQASRLKRKVPPRPGLRLPSLEWLEKVNSRVILLSTLMVFVGFLAGVVLKVVGERRADELSWSDPVVWSSGLMLAWLLAASLFNAVYKPARMGRKVAYLTVVSFVFLVFSLAVLLLVDTDHGGRKEPLGPVTRQALANGHLVAASGGGGR